MSASGWQILPEYPIGTIGNSCIKCHSDLRPRSGNRADGHEQALDTGVSIDFEGRVVFCETCIIEIATQLGMIREGKVDELRKNNRELGRQNRQFSLELETCKRTIKSLKGIFG